MLDTVIGISVWVRWRVLYTEVMRQMRSLVLLTISNVLFLLVNDV